MITPRTRTIGLLLVSLQMLFVAAGMEGQEADALVAAYQKEFVYLDNEIRLLQSRIDEVDRDGAIRVEAARQDLQQLEARLLQLNASVDRRTEELRIVEEQRNEAVDASSTLESIVTQANLRLEDFGIEEFAEANPEAAQSVTGDERTKQELSYAFDASFSLLGQLASVRVEPGRFFLQDGVQVDGNIVHLGRIASFGVSQSGSGTLAPAGAGRLRIVDPGTDDVARRLERGDATPTLPIFLYESLDYLADRSEGKTIAETIESGGMIGYVIVILGVIALLLTVMRAMLLLRASSTDKGMIEEIASHVEAGDYHAANSRAAEGRGALARVVSATLGSLKDDPKRIDDVMAESILNEQPALERFRSAITVFAAVAPLLGLLGTVTGMISTFDVITEYGTGDPKLLSGGISEALVTTELGLIVAIPTLLAGNLLTGWADRIVTRLETSALRVVNTSLGLTESA